MTQTVEIPEYLIDAFPANEHNGRYLRTKAERFGHLF